jgi:hypothetical protein
MGIVGSLGTSGGHRPRSVGGCVPHARVQTVCGGARRGGWLCWTPSRRWSVQLAARSGIWSRRSCSLSGRGCCASGATTPVRGSVRSGSPADCCTDLATLRPDPRLAPREWVEIRSPSTQHPAGKRLADRDQEPGGRIPKREPKAVFNARRASDSAASLVSFVAAVPGPPNGFQRLSVRLPVTSSFFVPATRMPEKSSTRVPVLNGAQQRDDPHAPRR